MSELRSVTCRMGSHSVTCNPTQVNKPRLNPRQISGTRFTYTRGIEGWVDLGGWLHTEVVHLPAVTQVLTRPGVEQLPWSDCRFGHKALPLRYDASPRKWQDDRVSKTCLDGEHGLFMFVRQIPGVNGAVQFGGVQYAGTSGTPTGRCHVAHVVPTTQFNLYRHPADSSLGFAGLLPASIIHGATAQSYRN